MEEKTAWESAVEVEAKTDSERYLAKLARRAFLSLWSYSNVHTDEGRTQGKGDGKELCDLLVVFGNHVLIFSDKACAFPKHPDIQVAWGRWYKSAVEKSVRQLTGAESFLKSHPGRIFLDKDCSVPFPFQLPDPAAATFHLIAVMRGSHAAAHAFWEKQSSGSLMIDTSLDGRAHLQVPFRIGWPAGKKRFVHVLDEMALDIILEEFDTVPDLIAYFKAKERFLTSVPIVTVAGEEQLVARYQMSFEGGQHALPEVPDGVDFVALVEGDWETYCVSQKRAARCQADAGSYMWDALIEYQSGFIRSGQAASPFFESASVDDHERVVRAMASETRFSRRILSEAFRYALNQSNPGHKFARIMPSAAYPNRLYVFLTLPRGPTLDYQDYRAARVELLMTYCHGLKLKFPDTLEVVGIASEPLVENASSQDFLFVSLDQSLGPEEERELREACDELGIFQDATMVAKPFQAFEYPQAARPTMSADLGQPAFMNRAMRRAYESQQKRAKGKPKRGR